MIEKTGPDNYSSWVEDIKTVLMENCQKIMTAKEDPPEQDAPSKDKKDYDVKKDRSFNLNYL